MTHRPSTSIPFNWPYMTGQELGHISEAHRNGKLAGDGPYTKKCHHWIESHTNTLKALLTHSCTASLEMSALLLDLGVGDEVIMPSYTFVSTANAFALRGVTPVFVDIRGDTLNIDETKIMAAITPKTKAIIPVHYGGVACEMDAIMEIAENHNLSVVEDAAQGVMASYKGKSLGSIGDLGAYSFHETKNLISGEGGALLVNNPEMIDRAEIIREKGTDRKKFSEGIVDKYTWQELGSSYLPGEIIAAFLWAQMLEAKKITSKRIQLWQTYHSAFIDAENEGLLRRPIVPAECLHNGHMYYILLPRRFDRSRVIKELGENSVNAIFHYIPLHQSPAGRKFCKISGSMKVTDDISGRILRLPCWAGLEDEVNYVVETTIKVLSKFK